MSCSMDCFDVYGATALRGLAHVHLPVDYMCWPSLPTVLWPACHITNCLAVVRFVARIIDDLGGERYVSLKVHRSSSCSLT